MCPFLNKSRSFTKHFLQCSTKPRAKQTICGCMHSMKFDRLWPLDCTSFWNWEFDNKKVKVWLTQRSTLLLYSMMDYPGLYSLLFQVQHWKELHSVLKIRIGLMAPPWWSFSCRWRHQYDLGSQPAVIIVYGWFFPTLALIARKLCTQYVSTLIFTDDTLNKIKK